MQLARQNSIVMNKLEVGKREGNKDSQGQQDLGTNGTMKSVHKEKEQKKMN